ncbi:hypothetical protein BK006_01220 [bacterium CG10_49_38]|nr:MAG: hypothetical protein BK006_01220 [bacterium CG10_49_38]
MLQKRSGQLGLIVFSLVILTVFGLTGEAWGSKSALVYQVEPDEAASFKVSSYLSPAANRGLFLTADAYLVADLSGGGQVLRHNEEAIFPIASVTKLMTALVARDLLAEDEPIVVSQQAWDTYGDSAKLRLGQTLPLSVALYPLLLSSSNDLAEAIAERAGRDLFIAEMNKRASRLKMNQTFFVDPSGLSPENVSTAADLVKLAQYLYRREPEILAITRLDDYAYHDQTWRNLNDAAKMSGYFGGKNGYTDEANRTLLSIFSVPITDASETEPLLATEKQDRLLAVILLASDGQKKDTQNLIKYLDNYVYYLGAQNGFIPVGSE